MLLTVRRRPSRRLAAGASVVAMLVLTACTGGSDATSSGEAEPDETSASPSPTPTTSPAEQAVAPLVGRPEIDLASLPLPDAGRGADPAAWSTSARTVRALAVASQKDELWSTTPGSTAISKVAAAAPPQVASSMKDFDEVKEYPPASLFWAPTFGDGVRPSSAKVVDARWASTPSPKGNG